jgi:hypothetical protein
MDDASILVRPLVAAIQQQQRTVGQSLGRILADVNYSQRPRNEKPSEWQPFLHALDMSNWIEAAILLSDLRFQGNLKDFAAGTPASHLIRALRRLRIAWEYLLSTRSEWEEAYFIAYAFGKMPALATPTSTQPALPDYDLTAEHHAAAIRELAPLFHASEILNQRFQNPGRTKFDAHIRFTQGHNFSYAHTSDALFRSNSFSDNGRKILVNWDAHADLSEPFDNPRMPLDEPFTLLQDASTFPQRVVISGSMSIAGWILPLIYQGLLSSPDGDSHVVWVVPKESQLTSNNYMEPYGKYSFVVGDWKLPQTLEEIEEYSTTTVGPWNVPGSIEIRRYSHISTLKSVSSREILRNQQHCNLHIVDPDDLPRLIDLLEGAEVALSIDADFAGTREPGLSPRKGYLPHYPLVEGKDAKARHEQLLEQLAEFVGLAGRQIRSVSIANSPNFTVAEETRKPIARILQILTGDSSATQPSWISNEVTRVAPSAPWADSHLLSSTLAIGGLSGLGIVASLLTRDWQRLRRVRSLLYSDREA